MEEKQTSFQKLMGIINKIGYAIMLNLLFLVSCVPVITIGPACSGLYSAVRYSIKGESAFQGFREGFKTRFLRNMLGGSLQIPVCSAQGLSFPLSFIWFSF